MIRVPIPVAMLVMLETTLSMEDVATPIACEAPLPASETALLADDRSSSRNLQRSPAADARKVGGKGALRSDAEDAALSRFLLPRHRARQRLKVASGETTRESVSRSEADEAAALRSPSPARYKSCTSRRRLTQRSRDRGPERRPGSRERLFVPVSKSVIDAAIKLEMAFFCRSEAKAFRTELASPSMPFSRIGRDIREVPAR